MVQVRFPWKLVRRRFSVAVVVAGRLTCHESHLVPQLRRYLQDHPEHRVDVFASLNGQPRPEEPRPEGIPEGVGWDTSWETHVVSERQREWHHSARTHPEMAQNLSSMTYHGRRAFERALAASSGMRSRRQPYDVVVKFRPDIVADALPDFEAIILATRRQAPKEDAAPKEIIHVPSGSDYGGLNDHIAFGTPRAMTAYFSLHGRTDAHLDAGCRLHPETLLDFHLRAEGVVVHRFPYAYHLDPLRHTPPH